MTERKLVLMALAALVMTSTAEAQWPDYPTPNVPRTEDAVRRFVEQALAGEIEIK